MSSARRRDSVGKVWSVSERLKGCQTNIRKNIDEPAQDNKSGSADRLSKSIGRTIQRITFDFLEMIFI